MTDMRRDSRITLALGGTSLFSASRDFSERYSYSATQKHPHCSVETEPRSSMSRMVCPPG